MYVYVSDVFLSPDTNFITCRDVTAGPTGATAVASKFADTLTLFPQEWQILPIIGAVATRFSPWLHL